MAELTVDDTPPHIPGRAPLPARLPITDISHWVERFSLMAAVLCSRFPDKAAEMFAYQATIVRAERNYEGQRWVIYDRQFRREALARKDLNWSVTDPRLYNEAFTGRARAIARCAFCLQDDHSDAYCPRNPNRPLFGWLPSPTAWPIAAGWPTAQALPPSALGLSTKSGEICRRFNEGRCKTARCKYQHACSLCHASHPLIECPQRSMFQAQGRSRSPFRPQAKGPAAGFGSR